jgi:hypothetical protein
MTSFYGRFPLQQQIQKYDFKYASWPTVKGLPAMDDIEPCWRQRTRPCRRRAPSHLLSPRRSCDDDMRACGGYSGHERVDEGEVWWTHVFHMGKMVFARDI